MLIPQVSVHSPESCDLYKKYCNTDDVLAKLAVNRPATVQQQTAARRAEPQQKKQKHTVYKN
jgi:hypothetical protein